MNFGIRNFGPNQAPASPERNIGQRPRMEEWRVRLHADLPSARDRQELASLFQEPDPEIFYAGLLAFGVRLEQAGNVDLAARVYAAMAEEPKAASVTLGALSARERLDAILGQGAIGPRAEFLLRRLAQESCEPTALLAMGTAGALFKVARLGMLSRLVAAPSANFFTRGLGARALASIAAFSLEAPAFTLTGHLANRVLGRSQDWSHLGSEIASSYLVLGGMRFAGWAVNSTTGRLSASVGAGNVQPVQFGLSQAGMLGGILLGHRLEESFGLREHRSGATTWIDSLALLLQFNVAGNLTHHAFGERFHAWEQGLELQTQRLQAGAGPRGPSLSISAVGDLSPAYAGAGTGTSREPPPHIFLTKALEPRMEDLLDSTGEYPVGSLGDRTSPELRLSYPESMNSILTSLETRLRSPDYLQGDRAALLQKRVAEEDVDTLWFQQAQDFIRQVTGVEPMVLDAEQLLQTFPGWEKPTDAGVLRRALDLLGTRGNSGSVARRVLEFRIPNEQFLKNAQMPPTELVGLASFMETESFLRHTLQLGRTDGEHFYFRVISLSFLEKMLQAVHGDQAQQFHYVEAEIPRDDVARLRGLRASPVGIARHRPYLGDMNDHVHPFIFSLHDAFFHAARDATLPELNRNIAARFYDRLRGLPEGSSFKESVLCKLADVELMMWGTEEARGFAKDLHSLLRTAFQRILASEDPYLRRSELREMDELMRDAHQLIRQQFSFWRELVPAERGFFRRFLELRSQVRRAHRDLDIHYPEAMQPLLHSIETAMSQPSYTEGSRAELLSKRPDIHLVDRLWFHQALDYAGRIPGVTVRELDAAVLLEPFFPREEPVNRTAIAEALAQSAREGSMSRRVLELSFPKEYFDSIFYGDDGFKQLVRQDPRLHYLEVLPFAKFVEDFLGEAIQLLAPSPDRTFLRIRIPALSFLEKLAQGVLGEDRLQFHFVPGVGARDEVMRLKGRRVEPVGISAQRHYFSEHEGDIHPFLFAQHDAFEHALRDAALQRGLPELAAHFYWGLRDRFPESPAKNKLMDDLSDLYFSRMEEDVIPEILTKFLKPMEAAFSGTEGEDSEQASAVLREALHYADAAVSWIQEIFPSQPQLSAWQDRFLQRVFVLRGQIQDVIAASALTPTEIPAEFRLSYPPGIDSALTRIEARLRSPGYLQGGREELLRKRPDEGLIDQVWFHQALNLFGRIPYVEVRLADDNDLLNPLTPQGPRMDPETLHRVRELLGERGQDGSDARQVLEVSFPRNVLQDAMGDPSRRTEISLLMVSNLTEAQRALQDRVELINIMQEPDADMAKARIIGLSYMEKLLQVVHGRDAVQFHYVDGTIPRDDVARLRGQRSSPVGISRHQLVLGDLGEAVFPVYFTGHDGIFHAPLDAEQVQGYPELAYRFYDFGRQRPERALGQNSFLDNFSELNKIVTQNGEPTHFGKDILAALRLNFEQATSDPLSKLPSEELSELLALVRDYQGFSERQMPSAEARSPEQREFASNLEDLHREIATMIH